VAGCGGAIGAHVASNILRFVKIKSVQKKFHAASQGYNLIQASEKIQSESIDQQKLLSTHQKR